ncbi:hypothetical protein FEDK69T_25380 [Flavobacterium enshiense DK69]|nr:hypothetical protein FEDK69T_25380 [Flavobacterium enshiense DK69]
MGEYVAAFLLKTLHITMRGFCFTIILVLKESRLEKIAVFF